MTKLTEAQLKHFKERLESDRQDLEKQLQGFADKDKDIENNYETKFEKIGDDMDDKADEVTNYGDNLGIEHSLEESLRLIDEALERIDKGTYGTCSNCQGEISLERLEAFPQATTCMKCEE